ncbi:hypothetical protein N0V93_005553 [Gnomoniopsis smithogilvyi]|uniref:Uncharacterized protein n=1 Tax=Gnomoniopsis smithogilvyi TaxID=1191159 RepID=A0A9W8YUM0_9PEZI|nr:hypothetical protein N0V93_005553 [Gnomoniopsis smithogilvyi]
MNARTSQFVRHINRSSEADGTAQIEMDELLPWLVTMRSLKARMSQVSCIMMCLTLSGFSRHPKHTCR